MRVLDFALATDGGTQIIDLECDDGEILMIGLDGRMDAPGGGRQLFIGGVPDSPDAKLLPIGSPEEAEIVALLEQWVEQTQGFIRREALMDADSATLKGQDLLDRLALEFVLDLRRRDVS